MRLAAVLLTGLCLLGCSGENRASEPADAAGPERAAVRPATDSYDQAMALGVLRADPQSGCLWLEQAGGSVGVELLLYGEQYRVDFSTDPPSVLDGERVVARVGESVEVGGGMGPGGVTGCPVQAPSFLGYFERK